MKKVDRKREKKERGRERERMRENEKARVRGGMGKTTEELRRKTRRKMRIVRST